MVGCFCQRQSGPDFFELLWDRRSDVLGRHGSLSGVRMRLAGVPEVQLGTITWPGGEYTLTPNDLLWAARAAAHEGDHEAVLWCWTNRWVSWGHARFDTLAEMIRAHSQPVNPIWQRGGRCCPEANEDCTSPCFESEGNPTGESQYCPCSQVSLDRRERAVTLSWEQIASSLRDKVMKWATARLTDPVPRATDFAALPCQSWDTQRRKGIRKLYVLRNCFYGDTRALSWPANYVQIKLGDRVAGDRSNWLVPVLLLGAGYGAWKLSRANLRTRSRR